jgi:molybdenum-dependent DNA-binding transcriptional regulator ModE
MPHLDNILVFVKVVEFESISKAARCLGMPISTVSRRLYEMERVTGIEPVLAAWEAAVLPLNYTRPD